uniref:sulfatase family protein n=1 Tax=Cephaloticoccus sp. TaxID=1985742 RepID=UPI00404B9E9B
MNRRHFIRSTAAGALASTLIPRITTGQPQAAPRPNILYLWTDQQSAAAMSNAGNPWLSTPAMDRLAREGVTFDRAYCTNPICVPSRTSWITGRMPHETTVTYNTRQHPIGAVPLSPQLRHDGYTTGYVGKWHIPHDPHDGAWHGFDYVENVAPKGTDPALPAACEKFLRQKHEQPFFLVASLVNPHDVCEWARRLNGLDETLPNGALSAPPPPEDCPPLPANFAIPDGEPEVIRQLQSLASMRTYPTRGWDEGRWRQYLWGYYRLIEMADATLGRVLATLDETGQDRDTLIIFSSDHGDGSAAHQWNQKTLFYDEVVRVPFIVRPPGGFAGGRRDARNLVCTNLDFFATVYDYAGIPQPVDFAGRSVRPLVERRPAARGHPFVVSQNDLAPVFGESGGVRGRMLRTERYKYIRYSSGKNSEQLFDLDLDPGEMRDLKNDFNHAAVLDEHRRLLDEWMQRHNDPFPAI